MGDAELLGELNRDVWRPFRDSYAAGDAAAHLAVFTQDLIRAGGPRGEVHGFEEYATQMRDTFAEVARRGDRFGIEFRFTERLAAGALASERGAFRITVTLAGGEVRVVFGRFHTFACKTDGRWRLAVDYDSSGDSDEETFAAGATVEDVAAFAG
jgi:ketosteroid isomerase-like protein